MTRTITEPPMTDEAKNDSPRLSPGEPSGEGDAAREAFAEIKRRVSRAREMMAEDYPQEDQSVTRASAHLLGVFCLTGKVEAALAPPVGSEACLSCGGKGYVEHEGGEGEGYPSRPEIEDCPSCTAPPSPGGADGLEPVAWLMTHKTTGATGYAFEREPEAYAREHYTVTPLYARPPEAAAEIEALRARVEWQPIETAPKDGQGVLAICATAYSPVSHVTWWLDGWVHYSRPAEKWHGGVGKWFPTHWMPLPEAPAQQEGV
ncbi:DUF551 domain-containing protein [Brevundimonas sp.]|uniref:DUF551 domain-containing protein n=1 Tax=Brevundimonas sp. TaxID=1871086 RepID=UPI002D54B479|nr:DUF551 domain-containing protein [Brevundimonas sp.]HYC66687.1 DUF551 domain-containing protein [Brevundimonas sp.]